MATDLEVIQEFLSDIPEGLRGSRTTCPVCSPHRRKRNEKTLSVKFEQDRAVFICHHCNLKGAVALLSGEEEIEQVDISDVETSLDEAQLGYLSSRGISSETASRCGLVHGTVYIRSRHAEVRCIGFEYENADGTRATKWRDGGKNFTQTGAAQSLWRIGHWRGGDLVICEGEIDALSFEEVGVGATSVPNGAPSQISEGNGSDKKFRYLWDAKSEIEAASRIVIAVDGDEPGRLLSEEIARRVGKGRCWQVRFPPECKDANDVLVRHGPEGLRKVLEEATPWPVSGLRDVSEYRSEVMSLHRDGFDYGVTTGLADLDKILKTCPQTLTICTGIPGVGKSSFLSWLAVTVSDRSGWPVAILSAETPPAIHLLQMAAIRTKRPYQGAGKMTQEELGDALDWLRSRFVILDESDTRIDSVLERAQAAVLRMGVRILIVDPYNFLSGSVGDAEEGSVAGINNLLVALKMFSVEHGIATWLVAHPVKMYRGSDGKRPKPTGYDVSGSASFFNLADLGITISRDEKKSTVTCWKARFPWVGKTGEVELDFDPLTGIYSPVKDFPDGWDSL